MDLKKTISSIFIVPTLGIDGQSLKSFNFLNAYIKDLKAENQYENAVYLLLKPDDTDKFKDFLDYQYDHNPLIIEDYDYEGGFVVLVYKFNPKYMEDYMLVKEGKYSKTSQMFQDAFPPIVKIIKNGKYKDELSLQLRIFRKTSDLREYWENKLAVDFKDEMEVWDTWDEEKEILDIDKIKEML